MKKKLKIGDHVEATKKVYEVQGIKRGQTGRIKDIDDAGYWVEADQPNFPNRPTETWPFDENELKLISK